MVNRWFVAGADYIPNMWKKNIQTPQSGLVRKINPYIIPKKMEKQQPHISYVMLNKD